MGSTSASARRINQTGRVRELSFVADGFFAHATRASRLLSIALALTSASVLTSCAGGGSGGGGSDGPLQEVVWGDGPNSVALRWNLPQVTESGEPLGDLAGIAVYVRSDDGSEDVARIPVGLTDQTIIRGMRSGSFSFTVAAYTSAGVESAPSEAVATGLP